MAVMADGSFPFGAVGLVHIENTITQHRRIGIDEELRLTVRPTGLAAAPEAAAPSASSPRPGSGARRPGRRSARCCAAAAASNPATRNRRARTPAAASSPSSAEWRLGGDLGRRYAAVSGDRNPIHMHAWTAKPLGFKRAIAHGMWTKARCLAAVESRLPDAFRVDVRFRKPIFLPGRVEFLAEPRATGDRLRGA